MCVLVAIQYQWFINAYRLKAVEFDERVKTVLDNTVSILDKREASQKVKNYFTKTTTLRANTNATGNVIQLQGGTPLRLMRENGSRSDSGAGTLRGRPNLSLLRTNRAYRDSIINNGLMSNIVWQVLTEIDTSKATAQERLRGVNLDSLLEHEFQKAGVDVTYTYKINSKFRDSILRINSVQETKEGTDNKTYSAKLFPSFPFPENDVLVLSVVNREQIIRQSLLRFFIISLLVFLLILGTLGFSVITVLRQKKLAQVQKDFVNNVTHELKTPIASISLAAETLLNEKVAGDKEKVGYFATRILKENHRMDQKIDRILLSAVAEERNFRTNAEPTDIHDLVAAALEEIKGKTDQYKAVIKTDFRAKNSLVQVDEQHVQNAIVNLLDNAIKYSKEVPEIELLSYNDAGFLYLVVSDKGIGISKKDQKHIFKKFYRASAGDAQEARGFGIGLSYVQQVIKAHGGTSWFKAR